MASDEVNQELRDLVRRLREMDSFLKSFLTSFQDDLDRNQVNAVESMVSEIEDAVKSIEQRPNQFMDSSPKGNDSPAHPVKMLETHLEDVTGIIEQVLEAEVRSIEGEFEDIVGQ